MKNNKGYIVMCPCRVTFENRVDENANILQIANSHASGLCISRAMWPPVWYQIDHKVFVSKSFFKVTLKHILAIQRPTQTFQNQAKTYIYQSPKSLTIMPQ